MQNNFLKILQSRTAIEQWEAGKKKTKKMPDHLTEMWFAWFYLPWIAECGWGCIKNKQKKYLHLCNNHFCHHFSKSFTFPAEVVLKDTVLKRTAGDTFTAYLQFSFPSTEQQRFFVCLCFAKDKILLWKTRDWCVQCSSKCSPPEMLSNTQMKSLFYIKTND